MVGAGSDPVSPWNRWKPLHRVEGRFLYGIPGRSVASATDRCSCRVVAERQSSAFPAAAGMRRQEILGWPTRFRKDRRLRW
jgi:hypothetical protein